MSSPDQQPEEIPGINLDENQSRYDGDGPQSRAAQVGPGARGSGAIAGNNVSGNSTGRGDVIGGNKSGHNINLSGIAVVIGILIALFFIGRTVIQSVGDNSPSASSINQNSSCSEFLRIEDPNSRTAIINRIATETGNRGIIGSPFVLSEVESGCVASNSSPIGTIVSRARGY